MVLGVLFYGAEIRGPIQILVRELEQFHYHCVHCIMGVGRAAQ